jgi:excisionase family DNA binding protein
MDAILVSRKEAAQALGLGRGKLDQLIAAGAIQVRRIGRRVLISREELQRFASDRTGNTRKRGKQAR